MTGLSDGSQTLAEARTYTSFGELSRAGAAAGNPYAYTGREWEPELGLYYYRARYYDPAAGRFLSEDPIGFRGGVNFYAYVGNNPVNFVDPLGLASQGGPYHPPAGVSLSCSEADSCSQLEGKMQQLLRMINSHTGWDRNVPPPRGGGRHGQEIADLWRAYANCQATYAKKCKDNCDDRKFWEKLKDAWNNFNEWMREHYPQPKNGPVPGAPTGPFPGPVPVPIP